MSLVLSNKGKGMQSSSEQPLVGEERYVMTRITAAKETTAQRESDLFITSMITDRIGLHSVLLPINHKNYNFREK